MTTPRPRLHLPTIVGRMRTDPGPLLLMAAVVALTTALTTAVTPLMASASDRGLADAVRRAGDQAALVATFDRAVDDYGPRTRDPKAVAEVRAAALDARLQLPKSLAAVVQPGIAGVTTTPLQLVDAGPGRFLTLAFLEGPDGAPRVRYTSGGPPRASVGRARADLELPDGGPPWPVQVALSSASAQALGLQTGDRLHLVDQVSRPVAGRVSGIFVPQVPDDPIWRTTPQLLRPARNPTAAPHTAAAAALVSAAALPDLRLAVPPTDLTQRITSDPRPDTVRWASSAALVRALVSLKASPAVASGSVSWDTTLDRVLDDGRAQVAAARAQAGVLLVALLGCALLVLWQAADLVVRRRARSVVLTRERGGALLGIGSELFVEVALCVVAGGLVGLVVTWLAVGRVGWAWWVAVPLLAAVAAAVTGAVLASRSTDPRRTPANRTARRLAARAARLRRAVLLGAVVAVAVLSFIALRERGTTGGPTAAGAPLWWSVAGALLVVAALPRLAGLLLDSTRRTTGGVAFFVAARLLDAGARALPLLVVTVTVAQLTFAIALTSTEQHGQANGALLSVGGDARVAVAPGTSATDVLRRLSAAPGVTAAVAGRVDDEVRASSRQSVLPVRLVAVPATDYEHLLSVSGLPDAPALAQLPRDGGDAVPALLLGGPPDLSDGLAVPGEGGRSVPLTVVGTAPRVQDTVNPVVVVDADTFARAGGVVTPTTVWVVGPGAQDAARASAGTGPVVLYADVLSARRDAALAVGLVRLASATSALLLLFVVLAVVLAAAAEADPRGEALGRLRSLGLRDRQLWGLLAGELSAPVVVGAVAGLLLGVSAAVTMFGRLSLERITGQVSPPAVSIPPWTLVVVAALVLCVLVLTHLEWAHLRRVSLGRLLRGAPPR